jgi:perosamine synthetase
MAQMMKDYENVIQLGGKMTTTKNDMNAVSLGTFVVTPHTRELVSRVLDTGRISYGPMCKEVEKRLAGLHDCNFAVLSNSGTSSLQVALQALKELYNWQDGDEVLVPAVTFVATANIVLHNRLKPVLVDVDAEYYDMNAELAEEAITPRTRAIIPVHLFGQASNISVLSQLAAKHGLKVIEDSCETMFVSHNDKKAGSWGLNC